MPFPPSPAGGENTIGIHREPSILRLHSSVLRRPTAPPPHVNARRPAFPAEPGEPGVLLTKLVCLGFSSPGRRCGVMHVRRGLTCTICKHCRSRRENEDKRSLGAWGRGCGRQHPKRATESATPRPRLHVIDGRLVSRCQRGRRRRPIHFQSPLRRAASQLALLLLSSPSSSSRHNPQQHVVVARWPRGLCTRSPTCLLPSSRLFSTCDGGDAGREYGPKHAPTPSNFTARHSTYSILAAADSLAGRTPNISVQHTAGPSQPTSRASQASQASLPRSPLRRRWAPLAALSCGDARPPDATGTASSLGADYCAFPATVSDVTICPARYESRPRHTVATIRQVSRRQQ